MIRFKVTQLICKYLPPVISGYFRTVIYPFKIALKDNIDYSRKGITGSIFSGFTREFHGYCFGIHGFFDWKNILIGKAVKADEKYFEIVEIGANIGTETIGFADIANKVHAFEPLPSNIKELEKIQMNNKHINIQIYPVAVGDNNSIAQFIIPPDNYSGIGKIVKGNTGESINLITVNVHKLDNYLEAFNSVKAIFIDTEGHEPFVLSGAIQTIVKFKPVVILEVSELLLNENGKSVKDIFNYFDEIQYECFNIDRFLLTRVKKENVSKFDKHTNWICIPQNSKNLLFSIKRLLYKHIFIPLIKI